jgi:AraC-like DNA-binding protein
MQGSLNLPVPGNYYSGTSAPAFELPRLVLMFSRTSAQALGAGTSYHYRYVLLVNLKTEGTVLADDGMYHVRPGQAFCVFPYQFHRFLELGSASLNWLFITFELSSPDWLFPLKNVPVTMNDTIISSLENLVMLYKKRVSDNINVVLLTARILNELNLLAATALPMVKNIQKQNSSLDLINKVNQYIYSKISSPIAVKEIARHVSVSESHLRTLYRKQVGLSLGHSIAEIRLLKAMGMLENNAMNISQIAFACGYDSLFSFSRAFKRRFKVSPREFKKSQDKRNTPLK